MADILVLTDFSEASLRAAEWALLLAQRGHTNLTLFHSYQGLEAIPYQTYGKRYLEPDRIVRLGQKSRNTLLEFAEHVAQKAESSGRGEFTPFIQVEFAEGDLSDNIQQLTLKNDIELVVMGATNKTSWGHVLMSSNIAGVVKKTAKPVLVVPIESVPRQVNRATFAVNFDSIELPALHNLVHLAGLFKFDLEIVDVIKASETAVTKGRTFMEKLRRKNSLFSMNYRTLKGKSIVSRLYQQCRRKTTDLLAVTHHQYYCLQQLFNKNTTRDALYELKLPLLIFPSGKM